MDFYFEQPIKQLPASFITQKPARLVLDFIDSKMQLSADEKKQKVNLGSLVNYNVVAVGNRVRAILDLERTISYSGSSAAKYTALS